MRGKQIKRERPTLKSAHDFFKEGSFLIDPNSHFLSTDEQEAELRKVRSELHDIVKRQFPRTQNLEYAILKSHLIVEYALLQYIRCFAAIAVSASDIRFTFSQKVEIAYLLGFGANHPTVLPTVQSLNKVRNQVAHSFMLDRGAVDELLRINSEDYGAFTPKHDRERIQALRWVCAFICGLVSGLAMGEYFATKCQSDPA